jgi:hypothetical protein
MIFYKFLPSTLVYLSVNVDVCQDKTSKVCLWVPNVRKTHYLTNMHCLNIKKIIFKIIRNKMIFTLKSKFVNFLI